MARPTLVNLETALWVERIGSFSGAARKLNASQPAISGRIRDLEASLKFRIFARRGHLMLPTPEGRELLDRVEPLLRELQTALGEVHADAGTGGVIRVGAGQVALTWFARVLGTLMQDAANFRYEISVERVPTLVMLLEQEKIDIALLPTPVQHPRFQCLSMGSDPMLWLMARNRMERYSPYSRRSRPSLADVLNHGPLWLPHKTSPYFEQQTQLLRTRGAHLRNVNVCSDIMRLPDLIASTGGLGCVPQCLVGDALGNRVRKSELQQVPELANGKADVYAVKRQSDHRPILRRMIQLMEAEGRRVVGPRGRSARAPAEG